MHAHHETPASRRRRMSDLRRAGYRGPTYLRGRPAYDYPIGRLRRSAG